MSNTYSNVLLNYVKEKWLTIVIFALSVTLWTMHWSAIASGTLGDIYPPAMYWTEQSNFFVFIWFGFELCITFYQHVYNKEQWKWLPLGKLAVSIFIVVTGTIYFLFILPWQLLIANENPWVPLNMLEHMFIPTFVFLDLIVFRPFRRVKYNSYILFFIYPTLYFFLVLIYGYVTFSGAAAAYTLNNLPANSSIPWFGTGWTTMYSSLGWAKYYPYYFLSPISVKLYLFIIEAILLALTIFGFGILCAYLMNFTDFKGFKQHFKEDFKGKRNLLYNLVFWFWIIIIAIILVYAFNPRFVGVRHEGWNVVMWILGGLAMLSIWTYIGFYSKKFIFRVQEKQK